MYIRQRTYPRLYKLFKSYGFSPSKSLEIIIDAKRGNDHALTFVKIVFNCRFDRMVDNQV